VLPGLRNDGVIRLLVRLFRLVFRGFCYMSFQDGAPPLLGQLAQHWPKKAPDLAIQRFLPSLWDIKIT
jgi:hypothetical protein